MQLNLNNYLINKTPIFTYKANGVIRSARNALLSAQLPGVAVGDLCHINRREAKPLSAEVVALQGDAALLAPHGTTEGIIVGARISSHGKRLKLPVGDILLGRVLDPFCNPLDHKPLEADKTAQYAVYRSPPDPLQRLVLSEQLATGIRSIDTCVPLAYGQRVGIMAQAGVGKSTLLGSIVKHADIDVAVIALCGERGREVREFVEDILGSSGLARSVVIVSTSDAPSLVRQLAPFSATTIAEYFRDKGLRVLLVVDSLTRTARAMRDTGLASGETPVRHGYPPSVYSELPRLLERAGTNKKGSITALYTLLLENEETSEPLAEEVKSLLDGHIVLSNKLATQGIRPAIRVSHSISRTTDKILDNNTQAARMVLLRAISRLEKDKDLILLGGTPDPELALFIKEENAIRDFLTQSVNNKISLTESKKMLLQLTRRLGLIN